MQGLLFFRYTQCLVSNRAFDLHTKEFSHIVTSSPWFMAVLRAVRELDLPSWCVGAGAVRNLVWDYLHGYQDAATVTDVDVAYFDSADLSASRDEQLEAQLVKNLADIPWEVTNQAAVHLWFEGYFGHSVRPLNSLEEAVASWPEYATAVGIRLESDDRLTVIAPYGLTDLFEMVVRRNPVRVSLGVYQRRILTKRYTERWPRVVVIP